MRKLPPSAYSLGPYEILKASARAASAFVLFRPVLFAFSVSVLILAYAAVHNRKIQGVLLSFPYDRFFQTIKSDKMITFYATILEIAFELVTAIVLAGVSVVITSWLLIEEAADRRNQKSSPYDKAYTKRSSDFMTKKESEVMSHAEDPEVMQSPKYSQHTYFLTPSPSKASRRDLQWGFKGRKKKSL